MDAFLKRHKRRLRDVWDAHDTGKRDVLSEQELAGFIDEMSGRTRFSRGATKVPGGLSSPTCGGSVLRTKVSSRRCGSVRIGRGVSRTARPRPGLSETPEVLDRLKSYMFNNMISAKRIFASLDVEECGWLEIEQLRQMVHKIAPDVSESEKRRLTAGLAWMDPRGEAKVRYIDLIRCAKIAKLKS